MDRKRYSKPELLAPAGDLARARTAIRYGADAVYIGGQKFSLRSRASNFSMEDIREACAFAKQYGSRIHVTV
ncbi:MAG: collagenase-like protease, partial [Solobacterium sp.]|nr:collagenase-like protease [Solobacterium sp.]